MEPGHCCRLTSRIHGVAFLSIKNDTEEIAPREREYRRSRAEYRDYRRHEWDRRPGRYDRRDRVYIERD